MGKSGRADSLAVVRQRLEGIAVAIVVLCGVMEPPNSDGKEHGKNRFFAP
jgi:hypothetical protein